MLLSGKQSQENTKTLVRWRRGGCSMDKKPRRLDRELETIGLVTDKGYMIAQVSRDLSCDWTRCANEISADATGFRTTQSRAGRWRPIFSTGSPRSRPPTRCGSVTPPAYSLLGFLSPGDDEKEAT